MNPFFRIFTLSICLPCLSLFAQDMTHGQGMVGYTVFNSGSINFSENSRLQNEVSENGDLPGLFTVGIAGFTALSNPDAQTQLGAELGLTFGFGGEVDSYAFSNGSGVLRVDSNMLLSDVFTGLFVSQQLGEKARIYLAAGGQLVWANLESDFDEDSSLGERIRYSVSGSGFGFGVYARAGLEFNYRNEGTLGIGLRAASSSVDFEGDIGEVDFEALQAFIVFTQKL